MKALLTFIFLTCISLQAQELMEEKRPMLYPFNVTMGGQTAEMQKDNILFAVIEKPVAPDSLLEIEAEAPMLIINAFLINENGEVMRPGQQPAVIFKRNVKSVKLDDTMDNKALAPGRYLANIVANGTTSRVVFVIEDKQGKIKIPSLKSVIAHLRKSQ